MRICQNNERVYFEFTKNEYIADYLKNQIINRIDLGFIIGNDGDRMFMLKSILESMLTNF